MTNTAFKKKINKTEKPSQSQNKKKPTNKTPTI